MKTSIKRKIIFSIFLGFVSALFSFDKLALALPSGSTSGIVNSPKELIDQVWQIIYRDYLDSSGKYNQSEWTQLRKDLLSKNYPDKQDSYLAIVNMLSSLEDPYTRFLDPKQFKEMKIDTSGQLSGVGIQLSLDEKTNSLVVVSPIEGTPAYRAGVKPNDVIKRINDKSTKDMTIENAVKLIRGKEGTSVNLGLERNGSLINVELIRAKIEILSTHSHLNITKNGDRIGYIRLKQFSANASREMSDTISNFEKKEVDGYVLDLRSNPGGLLEASVDIARQWLNKGVIVSTQTRDGIKDIRRANGKALTDLPLVIIVNEGSASASEILSAAIQENQRGLLVGKKTFGKGLVQSVRSLSDGSGLTVTIAKYLTPSGKDIHENGISPDIDVDLSEDEKDRITLEQIGTNLDSQYRSAETTLLKLIKSSAQLSSYKHDSTNLSYALNSL